ncbi:MULTISPECIES: DUF5999 family protein [Streptomyces]|uniref:Uncharacterized protein n=2 Tax=Streptomyces rimosus subsp. rimosus TaxID=132474 RepID=L8F323_STRR1|nr:MULTISPECIES: DUF5999 family protein [Streptomyces]KOG74985.1 hypothetical protein ADK78_13520 [Kitasatospora aureofaciens]MYT41809.1 hypothetical protein [Streptomyces sp. SID5471]KOT41785.1 hypothetical protein ADK84_10550 [Streptomyces sp. NRRL WC-3701]KOT43943.1 hypothetical protein ADK42_06340 [Streptomyces rimosus subsp. rimosus]KOT67279.1 hypothetical protein ADK44_03720 [Streptomyces rimosus subsp. rimosus]
MPPTDNQRSRRSSCQHQPPCPPAEAPDREAAHIVATHPEQGWALRCNGVLTFEDMGELRPDGQVTAPHRLLTLAGAVT